MKHKTDHTRDRKRVEHAKNQKRERNVGANNAKRASNALLGEQRTNIRMSKLARTMQTAAAKINWSEMVKMLFRADPHSGRKDEIRKLISPGFESSLPYQASYSIDQVQYLLSLLLIISIAEKQTQEIYGQQFAQRCDAIGKEHNLPDDQYWKDGTAPKEWTELDREFEQASLRILIETLTDYDQHEIANLVQTVGAEHLFKLIKNVRGQFVRVLRNSDPGNTDPLTNQSGSLPETLESLQPETLSTED